MEIKKETKEILSWDIELCESSATIENGILKGLIIRQKGPVPQDEQIFAISIPNEERLRQTHKAMTELIQHLDNGRMVTMKSPEPLSFTSEIGSLNDNNFT